MTHVACQIAYLLPGLFVYAHWSNICMNVNASADNFVLPREAASNTSGFEPIVHSPQEH